jgi:ABC-type sugar transport system substrate-binding protein
MRIAALSLLLAGLAGATPAAFAAEGKVVWNDPSCMFFMVQLDDGFGSYNIREGQLPDEGDMIEGALKEEGAKTLTNKTSGKSMAVIPMALSPRLHPLIHSSPAQCKRRFTNK